MKRKLKSAASIVLLSLVLLYVYATTSLHVFIDPFFSRWQSRRLLAAATTPQQLQEVVGSLGAFYTFSDGSWLAIRYRDSHGGGIWSVAIARDSGGGWYQSREHFCGAFRTDRHLRQLESTLGDSLELPSDERSRWILQLGAPPDLQTARQRITSRYFTQLQ